MKIYIFIYFPLLRSVRYASNFGTVKSTLHGEKSEKLYFVYNGKIIIIMKKLKKKKT